MKQCKKPIAAPPDLNPTDWYILSMYKEANEQKNNNISKTECLCFLLHQKILGAPLHIGNRIIRAESSSVDYRNVVPIRNYNLNIIYFNQH